MPVRFQADADFNQIIVAAVVRRTPEIDFRTATAAGLAGVDDAAVLAIAAQDERINQSRTHRRSTESRDQRSGRLADSHLGRHGVQRVDQSNRVFADLI